MATQKPRQLANLRVSAETLNSSASALHVVQLDSTGGIIGGSPGGGSTQVSIREILSSSGGSLIDSSNVSLGVTIRAGSAAGTEYTDGDVDVTVSGGAILFDNSSNTLRPVTLTRGLPVNIVAGSASSTQVAVSSIAGAVTVRSSAADFLGTVYQSTYANFNTLSRIADRDQSTQVAGVVNTDPPSTTWGLAVRQVGAVAASTQVAVSSVAGIVAVRHAVGNSTAADYIPVRIVDSSGTGFLAPGLEYVDGSTTSTLAAPALAFNNSSNNTMRLAGSSSPFPVHMRTSSGADMGDSTNNALRVNVVAGAAGGSTEVTVRQSTYTDFNALSRLADRDNSSKVAAVLSDVQPASTAYGLVVRMPAPITDSTNNALRVNVVAGAAGGSTEVTIRQSTFADLNCRINAPSTANSSNYLPVRLTNSTAFLEGSIEYTDGSTTSTLAGPAMFFNNSSNNTMRMVGSTSPLPVAIISGAGSGGTAQADEVVFSSNVTSFTPIGGAVLGSTSAVAPGEVGVVNMSSNRAIWTFPVDSSGGRITDSTQRALRVTSVDAGGSTQVTVSSGSIKLYGSSGESVGASTAAPAANDQGLFVRQVGYSTTVQVSSIAGAVIMRSSAADAMVTASQGGTWNIGTVTAISSLAGAVIVRSSAADFLGTVYQSTYTALNGLMRLADRDQSTQVAGVVNTDPPSTTWGLAVRQVGAVAASTQVAVSSVAGRVSFAVQHVTDGILNAGDSTNNALRVNVVAGSAAGSTEVTVRQSTYTDFNGLFRLADRDASTQVAAVLNGTPASTVWALAVRTVGAAAGSTEVTVRQSTYTDFNALSRIADRDNSTQVVAVLNATPASSVWALAIRDVVPQSTTVNISSLAGAVIVRSSAADSLHTVYQSTFSALQTQINAPSTANSSNFLPVRITNSTAFLDGSLEYTDGSTVSTLAGPALMFNNSSNNTMRMVGTATPLPVAVSSLAGAVITRSSAADSLHTVYQSTFANLQAQVNAPSTANSSNFLPVRITNSTAYVDPVTFTNASTASVLVAGGITYSNSSNDTMRLVGVAQPLPVQIRTGTLDLLSTTTFLTSSHSTARYSLVSSAAGVAHKVFAYFIGSTHTFGSTFIFQSSGLGGNAGSDKFHVNFGSGSSGITGANMSVTPPAYLFKTAVNDPLVCYIEGGSASVASTTLVRVSISYFTEA